MFDTTWVSQCNLYIIINHVQYQTSTLLHRQYYSFFNMMIMNHIRGDNINYMAGVLLLVVIMVLKIFGNCQYIVNSIIMVTIINNYFWMQLIK